MIPTEHEEQATLVEWFDKQYPQYKGRLFAIPNGAHLAGTVGQRSAKMNKAKKEGLRVGVPDLMLPVPCGGLHGLFIEMKRKKGSKTTEEQIEWLDFLGEQGYMVALCMGFEPAKNTIEAYLKY